MRVNRILVLIITILLITVIVEYLWFDNKIDGDEAVALINNTKITEDEFMTELKDNYGKEVLEDLINKKVIAEAAANYGITANQNEINRQYNEFMKDYDTEEEFIIYLEEQMGWTKDELIDFIEYYTIWEEIATMDINVTDEQISAYFEKNKSNYSIPESFHIQQIVVRSEVEAEQVVNELANGSDFNTLAKERSMDYLSISTGGDLGKLYVNDPSIDPAIIDRAKTMAINDIATVQIGDYYAVIQLLGHEQTIQYSLDEVKEEIRREIALSQANSLPLVLDQLKKDMNVQILDDSLKNN